MNNKKSNSKQEDIQNIPNFLTLIRFLMSFLLIYAVIKNFEVRTIVALFVIAALTDFFDGYIARKYNLVTDFGRKFDLIADRVLMISLVIALLVYMIINDLMTQIKVIELLLIMTREILTAPFFITSLFLGKRAAPHARLVGKITTVFQGFALPMLLLGWSIGWYFAIICSITGLFSAGYYIYDSLIHPDNPAQKKLDKKYQKLYS